MDRFGVCKTTKHVQNDEECVKWLIYTQLFIWRMPSHFVNDYSIFNSYEMYHTGFLMDFTWYVCSLCMATFIFFFNKFTYSNI